MQVQYKYFRGTFASWEELFVEASQFATEIGWERLINVSHAVGGSDGTVVVWYWDETESAGSGT